MAKLFLTRRWLLRDARQTVDGCDMIGPIPLRSKWLAIPGGFADSNSRASTGSTVASVSRMLVQLRAITPTSPSLPGTLRPARHAALTEKGLLYDKIRYAVKFMQGTASFKRRYQVKICQISCSSSEFHSAGPHSSSNLILTSAASGVQALQAAIEDGFKGYVLQ